MRKLGFSFVLGLVPVVSAVQTLAQSAVPVTLTKAGRLPVYGDPLADITELERVRLGMKGGKVARNDLSRGEPRPRTQPS